MDRRPTVLVDQDGPLSDFDRRFYELCVAQEFPMHGGDVHAEAPCAEHRFLTDCLEPEHSRLARKIVNESRWFLELPPVDGAVEGMAALAEVADVWIVTKPLEANPNCRDDKAAWIRHYLGAEWERRLILAPDKTLVRGDVLVDDAIKREWIPRAEWLPVCFPTSWNGEGSQWSDLARWTWADGSERLLELAERRMRVRA